MNLSKNDWELIDKFFEGTCTEEEQQAFEQKKETDADFLREVKLQEYISLRAEKYFRESLKNDLVNHLRNYEDEENNKAEGRVVSFRPMLAIAASVSLLLVVVYFINQGDGSNRMANNQPDEELIEPESVEPGQYASSETLVEAFHGSVDSVEGISTISVRLHSAGTDEAYYEIVNQELVVYIDTLLTLEPVVKLTRQDENFRLLINDKAYPVNPDASGKTPLKAEN